MNLTPRQLATTLAALRYWQREGRMSAGHEHDIASAGDSLVPLNDDEINALYEDLIHAEAREFLAPPDPEEETRRAAILELAREQCGDAEIDGDAILSEGDDNGCYVSSWVWCSFEGTEFDKGNECSECGAATDDGEGYDGLCGNCADIKERRLTTTQYTDSGID